MKLNFTIALIASLFVLPVIHISTAQAEESHSNYSVLDVGNKICPVSGERIGSHGKAFKVEHEGRSYNLCCKMCKKDFEKNPDKYIKKLEEMMGSENTEGPHHEGSYSGHDDHNHGDHH